MFQNITETVLIGVPISDRIATSCTLTEEEKRKFGALLSYFTEDELSELRNLV